MKTECLKMLTVWACRRWVQESPSHSLQHPRKLDIIISRLKCACLLLTSRLGAPVQTHCV